MQLNDNTQYGIPPERFFPYLTWKQVQGLPDHTVLVLPIGATEQHGPHMPLFVDVMIAEAVVGAALRQLPDQAPIYALAPLAYTRSSEHAAFPGTISLSTETLLRTLVEIGGSLWESGITRLVLVNSHGGNAAVVDLAAQELRQRTGINVFNAGTGTLGLGIDLSPQEVQGGMHAADQETSVMLAIRPDLVEMAHAATDYPPPVPDDGQIHFRPGRRGPGYAWLTGDLSKSGVIGDPTGATAEKGRQVMATRSRNLAHLLLEALNWST